jgi:hypothetical protein
MFLSHHALMQATEQRQAAGQVHAAAVRRLQELNRQAAQVRSLNALMNEARQAGFGPGQWAIRRMDIRQATMTRETFNGVLAQMTRNRAQVFGADEFEVSVKDAGGSLFETPAGSGSDPALSVTLSGTLYFRLGAP